MTSDVGRPAVLRAAGAGCRNILTPIYGSALALAQVEHTMTRVHVAGILFRMRISGLIFVCVSGIPNPCIPMKNV